MVNLYNNPNDIFEEDENIIQIDQVLPPTRARSKTRGVLKVILEVQAVAQVLSNVYDFLAPSEDSIMAALQEQQRINKEIADKAGISETELYRMSRRSWSRFQKTY